MRNAYLPTVTTHTLVERLGNDAYQIDGWIGSDRIWQAVLSGDEAERFWKALDKVLYPLT
jgi:hypothetical protein